MSTVTTLLNLVKPASPEQFSLATYNNNLDLIDGKFTTNEKNSKGTLAYSNNPATSTGLAGTAVMCDLTQVNLVAGRWYRATYRVDTVCPTLASIALAIVLRKSVTTDNTATGTDLDGTYTIWTAPVANAGQTTIAEFKFKATSTETINLKAVMSRATSSAGYNISGRELAIDDMGAQF